MSDEYILKQLDNDANVIGYHPNLEYKKDRTAVGEALTSENTEVNYDPEKDTKLYTKTLNGFADNTPSSVLSNIQYVLKNINRLKQKLAKRFNEDQALKQNPYYNGDQTSDGILSDSEIIMNNARPGEGYNPYNDISQLIEAGENGDIAFADQFAEQYDSIWGSVIPGLINKLSQIENKLANLNVAYSNTFYGKPNISLQEARDIDASYVSNLKLMERDGSNGTINYLTLSFDSILNKTVSYCVFQDNKSAIQCAKVIDSHEENQATSNDMDIITKLFDDIEKELDVRSRGYMRNEDQELVQKAMYNYYEKRKNLNDVYSLYRNNPESKFLGRKTQEYTKNLTEAVKNVNRVLLYNQNYLNHITELETQKYNLQQISRSTSSNS